MSSNIGDFVRELDSASVAVEDDALELKRLVSLQLLDGLVYGTPVGNPDLWQRPAPKGYVGGHARSSWQVTHGSPATDDPQGIDPDGSPTVAKGSDVIERADLEQTLYITSNTDYIVPIMLEGHSTQVPEGQVLAIVERVKAQFP